MLKELLLSGVTTLNPTQLDCLAKNVYFEARNQSEVGMVAVSHVVLNRVKSVKFPNDICSVVTQAKKRKDGSLIRNKCQFSWYCDGLSDYPKEKVAWNKALRVAKEANILYQIGFDTTNGSLFYHSRNVEPYWAKSMEYVTEIDDHLFYREK